MSLVADQICFLDAYLDRLPVLPDASSGAVSSDDSDDHAQQTFAAAAVDGSRVKKLLSAVQSLGTAGSAQTMLPAKRIRQLLISSGIPEFDLSESSAAPKSSYETEIEWLVVSKAAVQLHGVILTQLLDHITPLSDHIWYWDDVLSSYSYSGLYTVQTSPWRFRAWTVDVYRQSIARMRSASASSTDAMVGATQDTLAARWGRFYGIVRDSVRERSFANIQRKVLSPVAFCRAEARRKQSYLKKLRDVTASGLGVLMSEGLQFVQDDEKLVGHDDLKGMVERSVILMDMILKEVSQIDQGITDFEEKVFSGVERDPELSVHVEDAAAVHRPSVLSRRLIHIIDTILPAHNISMKALVNMNGRPPAVVRYWLPGIIGVVSSTTVLQLLVKHKADILTWIYNLGATVRDFWFNWVVEPTWKVVQTIRHDKTSEIAIMSRDSLRADRESLERMVVDFAIDNPRSADVTGPTLTEAQITAIRSKVAEGDVTPVLKAFEKELRSPLSGAIRGDLIRSLLIQVQKTKVDLEVAMTGIDSLLKSQELLFGFAGLTPGVLVSIGMVQYLRSLSGGRSGQRRGKKTGQAVRVLRNMDRILSEARPTENNSVLSYQDFGLLLCEVEVLRGLARELMPANIEREFLEDASDLAKLKGVKIQVKALERIRWAYARWLQ